LLALHIVCLVVAAAFVEVDSKEYGRHMVQSAVAVVVTIKHEEKITKNSCRILCNMKIIFGWWWWWWRRRYVSYLIQNNPNNTQQGSIA
jgi:hypothetical protein